MKVQLCVRNARLINWVCEVSPILAVQSRFLVICIYIYTIVTMELAM